MTPADPGAARASWIEAGDVDLAVAPIMGFDP